MHPRFTPCILLLLILALTLPVFASAAPAMDNARLARTIVPTTTTPAPQTIVNCSAPCRCLAYTDAVSLWGDGGFTQCAELPCEVTRSVIGAPVKKFCFKQKPVTTVTTQSAFPAITTPVNQPAPAKPTTSRTPFPVPQTTPLAVVATQTPTLAQFSDIPAFQTAGNGTIQRPVISIGNYLYRPRLGLDSPYLVLDASDKYLIQTFLETDRFDNGDAVSHTEVTVYRDWTDYTKLRIDKTETRHVGNFRYNTTAKNVRIFLWQVSRFPFPNDPGHWQAKYIPGLVALGPVEPLDSTIDAEGFRYFRINFAKIASRNPGDPPYYSGTAHLNPAGSGGRVVVADVTRLPFNLGGVLVKKVNLGILSLDLPIEYTPISPGEFTEAEMAHPNEGLTLTCPDCTGLRTPSPLENLMTNEDQKFYVRLVPIYQDNSAGIPTIPVEVTVHRPQPCPAITQDVTVKPPSARIVWYMRPYTGTSVPSQWVTIGETAFWNASAGSGNGSSGSLSYFTSSMMGGFDIYQSGMHYVVPPAAPVEKSWWDKMVDTFGKILDYIAFVVNQYSNLWNKMKEEVVNVAATVLSYTTTLGYVKCEDISGCKEVLSTALDMAMVAVGLPPTLPTSSELTDMGTDYMVKLGADQLGAGEAYDTAKDLYKDVPDYAKQPMKDAAESGAQQLVSGETDQRHSMVFNGQNCEQLQYCGHPGGCFQNCANTTPDPIFNANHPATVMVWVENPNTVATDRVVLAVSDSWNLYNKETRIIPSLKPGEGISVPVVLYENYDQFLKENGGPCEWDGITWTDNVHTTSSTNVEECTHGKWVAKLDEQGEDAFRVTFSMRNTASGSAALANLDENSNGKWLGEIIVTDDKCNIPNSVRYPPGWQIYTTGYSINPLAYDNLFEEKGVISSTRGYLRKK